MPKGWYDQPETDDQFIARFVANTHGELSELWEAHRKGLLNQPCDKDAGLTYLEEEMADIIIRTLDACGRMKVGKRGWKRKTQGKRGHRNYFILYQFDSQRNRNAHSSPCEIVVENLPPRFFNR